MLLPRISALLLAAGGVAHAYKHASPFFLVSSDPLPSDAALQSAQMAKALDVEDRLVQTLGGCTAQRYTVVSQRGVALTDVRDGGSFVGFRRTRRELGAARPGAVVDIPQVGVLWEMDAERVRARLEAACEAQGRRVRDADSAGEEDVVVEHIVLKDFPADPGCRAVVIEESDQSLVKRVADVNAAHPQKSVLIYITTRGDLGDSFGQGFEKEMEMDEWYYELDPHGDLKRDVYPRQSDSNDDVQAGMPLFEKYQFFTPALFMGLTVSLLLVLILWVGVSAIAGLEVSYAAFNKEMGPQAQKGKQG